MTTNHDGSPELRSNANIFISYSRKDINFVDRLGAALITRKFKPLIDRTDILAFEEWWKRIKALIISADTVVFVVSPDAVCSTICAEEVSFAASLKKRIAPVVCRPCDINAVPETLRQLNFISFAGRADFESTVDNLAKALTTDIEWIRKHTWFTEVACRWDFAGRPNTMLLRGGELLAAEQWLSSQPSLGRHQNDLQLAFISTSRNHAVQHQQSLDHAARSSNQIVSEVVERLRGQMGVSQALVVKILENAQGLVSGLGDEAPSVHRARAIGLTELSSTLLAQKDAKAALVAAEKAIRIFDDLLQSPTEDTDTSADLLVALDRAGDALFELGRHDEALGAYERSLRLARTAYGSRADAASSQHLSVALEKVADAIRHRGQSDEALVLYRESLMLRKELAQNSNSQESQRDVAISIGRIAETLWSLRSYEAAIADYAEALEIINNAVRRHPENAGWQRETALIYERLGNIYREREEWNSALSHYESALSLTKQLVASDTTNAGFIIDNYRHYGHVGDALLLLGQPNDALLVFNAALGLAKHRCVNQIDQECWQAASAFFQRSCSTFEILGATNDALAIAQESATFLDSDHNPWRASQVAQALGNIAWYALLSGQFGLALIAAQRANQLGPDNVSFRANLLYSLALSDRTDEAHTLYVHCKEERMINHAWNSMVADDLHQLEDHGIAVHKLRSIFV
jgi:tetratricopeptide (TPR) repeat protein